MQRRSFLKNAAAGAAAGTLAAPAIVRAQPSVQWRMAASWPKSLDTLFGGAEHMVRRVAEMTDGKFQIRPFAAGEIVPALQVLDAVGAGTIEMGHTASYYYFGKDPAFALATSVPFGPNTRQNNAWWYHGGGAEAMAPLFSDYGCVALLSGNTGCQMAGWFRREVESVDDLEGLKFRIAGLGGIVLERLGVVPQQIAGAEVYPALEQGTIDAAEWVGPYDDEKLGFYKVAQYYYYPGWWEGGSMLMTLVNQEKWNALPETYRAALAAAAAESNTRIPARYDALNPGALRRLVARGTKLRAFPRDVMAAAEKEAYEVYEQLGEQSEHWKRIYPEWKKFRDDQFLWFRVAELSYDSYAFTSKVGS